MDGFGGGRRFGAGVGHAESDGGVADDERDFFRGDIAGEIYDAGGGEVGAENLNGRLGRDKGGFEVKEGDAAGAMFEESAGGSESEGSRPTSDDGVAFDGEAGKSTIGGRKSRIEWGRGGCEGVGRMG